MVIYNDLLIYCQAKLIENHYPESTMTLYKKKYRVESARKPQHDYRSKAAYFVTICTRKKLQWFGEIKSGRMILSEIGEIVRLQWLKTFELRQYIETDAWCIMPNHLHGIIRIHAERRDVPLGRLVVEDLETPQRGVSTKKNQYWSADSLSSIVNQFKGAATKRIHAAGFQEFQWQARYHDHIIRSDDELVAIKKYITGNPDSWDKETIPWHDDAVFWSL